MVSEKLSRKSMDEINKSMMSSYTLVSVDEMDGVDAAELDGSMPDSYNGGPAVFTPDRWRSHKS